MSLSTWEQRALDSIKDGLADSDPRLVTLLTTFTRLTSGEEMPVREKIRVTSPRTIRYARRKRLGPRGAAAGGQGRPVHHRLGLQRAVLLLWLLITMALIAVGLSFSRGGSQGTCTETWATFCADSTPTPSSRPASGDRGANQVQHRKATPVQHTSPT